MSGQAPEISNRRGKAAGGYVLNCGVRQYISRAEACLGKASEWCNKGERIEYASRKIKTALGELDNARRKVDEFERMGELIALVYAMRYRDNMTFPQIVMALRSMPPDYWLTVVQVRYLLGKDESVMIRHRNAC